MKKEKWGLYYFAIIYLVAFVLFISGCATQSKSVGLGGAIGAGTGAVLGGIADPGKDGEYRTRNVILGTALGGMAGMISASVIHENTEEKKREAFQQGKASVAQGKPQSRPNLKDPKVDARWIEAKTIGNRYVEAHWEYLIIEPARWEDSQ